MGLATTLPLMVFLVLLHSFSVEPLDRAVVKVSFLLPFIGLTVGFVVGDFTTHFRGASVVRPSVG